MNKLVCLNKNAIDTTVIYTYSPSCRRIGLSAMDMF